MQKDIVSSRDNCLKYEDCKKLIDSLSRASYSRKLNNNEIQSIKSCINNNDGDFKAALENMVKDVFDADYQKLILNKSSRNSMTKIEKMEYIIQDFMVNVIEKTGNMPDDMVEANEWYKEHVKLLKEFGDKYKKNSMKEFAGDLGIAYMNESEREYNSKFYKQQTLNL